MLVRGRCRLRLVTSFKYTKEMYVWEIVCNLLHPVTKINPADSEMREAAIRWS